MPRRRQEVTGKVGEVRDGGSPAPRRGGDMLGMDRTPSYQGRDITSPDANGRYQAIALDGDDNGAAEANGSQKRLKQQQYLRDLEKQVAEKNSSQTPPTPADQVGAVPVYMESRHGRGGDTDAKRRQQAEYHRQLEEQIQQKEEMRPVSSGLPPVTPAYLESTSGYDKREAQAQYRAALEAQMDGRAQAEPRRDAPPQRGSMLATGAGAAPGRGRGRPSAEEAALRKQQYADELKEQMRQKEEDKSVQKMRERQLEEKKNREIADFNPFGKGGGGAPLRDATGRPRADLKGYLKEKSITSPTGSGSPPGTYVSPNPLHAPGRGVPFDPHGQMRDDYGATGGYGGGRQEDVYLAPEFSGAGGRGGGMGGGYGGGGGGGGGYGGQMGGPGMGASGFAAGLAPLNMGATGGGPTKQQQYQADLEAQMQQKKNAKENDRQREMARERREAEEIANYNPWGRPGAGAPVRNVDGSIVANLKGRTDPAAQAQAMAMQALASPPPVRTGWARSGGIPDAAPEAGYNPQYGGGGGGGGGGYGGPPAGGLYGGPAAPPPTVGGFGPTSPMPGGRAHPELEHQAYLRQQMEEKKRKKEEEEARAKAEDAKIEAAIKREQEKAAEEARIERQKRADEEARKEAELRAREEAKLAAKLKEKQEREAEEARVNKERAEQAERVKRENEAREDERRTANQQREASRRPAENDPDERPIGRASRPPPQQQQSQDPDDRPIGRAARPTTAAAPRNERDRDSRGDGNGEDWERVKEKEREKERARERELERVREEERENIRIERERRQRETDERAQNVRFGRRATSASQERRDGGEGRRPRSVVGDSDMDRLRESLQREEKQKQAETQRWEAMGRAQKDGRPQDPLDANWQVAVVRSRAQAASEFADMQRDNIVPDTRSRPSDLDAQQRAVLRRQQDELQHARVHWADEVGGGEPAEGGDRMPRRRKPLTKPLPMTDALGSVSEFVHPVGGPVGGKGGRPQVKLTAPGSDTPRTLQLTGGLENAPDDDELTDAQHDVPPSYARQWRPMAEQKAHEREVAAAKKGARRHEVDPTPSVESTFDIDQVYDQYERKAKRVEEINSRQGQGGRKGEDLDNLIDFLNKEKRASKAPAARDRSHDEYSLGGDTSYY